MAFHLQVINYRGIKQVDFTADGVCAIVGPNGAGKSTLLSSLDLLTNAFWHGFGKALSYSGGPYGFANFDLPQDAETMFSIEIAGFQWELRPVAASGGAVHPVSETLKKENAALYNVAPGIPEFHYAGKRFATNEYTLGLKRIYDSAHEENDELEAFIQPLANYRNYYNYCLWRLRKDGSFAGAETELKYNGENAFSVLRNWQTSRPYRRRYEFIIDTLRKAAFPSGFRRTYTCISCF